MGETSGIVSTIIEDATGLTIVGFEGRAGGGPLTAVLAVGVSGATGETRPSGGEPFKSSEGRVCGAGCGILAGIGGAARCVCDLEFGEVTSM